MATGVMVASLLLAGVAGAAMVRVGGLVLRADGGFTPRELPRRAFAPIEFEGRADFDAVGGGPPPPLQQAILSFDRDGRLTTRGLATCSPSQIEAASPARARAICPRAVVGTGHVEALVSLPGQAPVAARSALTLFNGPRLDGKPTVIVHAQMTSPVQQTFAVVVPLERRAGYSYRATFDVPQIAGGAGALTHVDIEIGKRYRSGGAELSYVSARCSDGVLETRGRFTFSEGTIIDGSVEKPCRARPEA